MPTPVLLFVGYLGVIVVVLGLCGVFAFVVCVFVVVVGRQIF